MVGKHKGELIDDTEKGSATTPPRVKVYITFWLGFRFDIAILTQPIINSKVTDVSVSVRCQAKSALFMRLDMLNIIRFLESEPRTDRERKILKKRLLGQKPVRLMGYHTCLLRNSDRQILILHLRRRNISSTTPENEAKKCLAIKALGLLGCNRVNAPSGAYGKMLILNGDFKLAEKVWRQLMSNQKPVATRRGRHIRRSDWTGGTITAL